MKNIIAATLFCLSLLIISQTALAQQSGFGLGAVINGPTGISYKAWLAEDVAVAGAVSFNIGDGTDLFYTQADVLVHGNNLLSGDSANEGFLSLYYGGGIGLRFFNNPDFEEVDLRIPVGVTYGLKNAPVDAFFELAPTLQIIETTRFRFNGAVGARFYLN